MRAVLIGVVLGAAACGGGGGSSGDDDGGAGAIDAAGDRPDAGESPPASAAELVAACVSLGSCQGQGPQECIDDHLPRLSGDEIRCLAAAGGDCVAAYGCIGYAMTPTEPSCTAGCDGDNAVMCAADYRYELDCPGSVISTGPTCAVGTGGAVCAGPGTCAGGDSYCDGTWVLGCQSGIPRGGDCARHGWTCSDLAPGLARCTDGTAIVCDQENYPRCEGSVLVECLSGFEIRQDCAAMADGVSCHVYPGDADGYCGLGSSCDPILDDGTCDGDVLTFCAAGESRSVDCGDLGFVGCQPAGPGVSRCTIF